MTSTVFVDLVGPPVNAEWLNTENARTYAPAQGTVVATAGQTVFTVPFAYPNGGKALRVFINGVQQIPVSSYAETNSTTVTFTEGLIVGSSVFFIW